MTVHESEEVTAQKVKSRLEKEFSSLPKGHFNVFRIGNDVLVEWFDFPLYEDVESIASEYSSSYLAEDIGRFVYKGYIDPETKEEVVGANHVVCKRMLSDKRIKKIHDLLLLLHGKDDYEYYRKVSSEKDKIDKMLDKENDILPKYQKKFPTKEKKGGLEPNVIHRLTTLVNNHFNSLNPDTKLRAKKIINKNDKELLRLIKQSDLNIDTNGIGILKHTPKNSGDVLFYQTALCLFVQETDTGKVEHVYRYGKDTIEQSVTRAKRLKTTFGLDPSIVKVAQYLYLRGK